MNLYIFQFCFRALARYVATWDYSPCKDDELELNRVSVVPCTSYSIVGGWLPTNYCKLQFISKCVLGPLHAYLPTPTSGVCTCPCANMCGSRPVQLPIPV